jgi:hypothetical protein
MTILEVQLSTTLEAQRMTTLEAELSMTPEAWHMTTPEAQLPMTLEAYCVTTLGLVEDLGRIEVDRIGISAQVHEVDNRIAAPVLAGSIA